MLRLACLSPEEIHLSISIGYVAAAFGIGATAIGIGIGFRRRDFKWLPFYVLLLAFHPAWTISVYRGDCGDARRFLSGLACLVFVALLLIQILWPQFSRQRFLLAACSFAWLLYLPLLLLSVLRASFLSADGFVGQIIMAYAMSARDIVQIAVTLSTACIVFWFARRWHERHAAV